MIASNKKCIPVGCVPPTAVAVCWGCLPQCWYTPRVWAWRPPGVGLETPRCGTEETPPGQTPQLPPWVCAWRRARHAGIPPGDLQDMLGYHHPPSTEFLTHASENITLPQTSFAGGNDDTKHWTLYTNLAKSKETAICLDTVFRSISRLSLRHSF